MEQDNKTSKEEEYQYSTVSNTTEALNHLYSKDNYINFSTDHSKDSTTIEIHQDFS